MTLTDYMSKKEKGRGLTSIEDSVDALIQRLKQYIEKRRGRLLTGTTNNTENTRNKRTEITKTQKVEEKQHLLIEAQNNAIRINHIKARIDTRQQNCRCWFCGDRDGTINHIIGEYNKLSQKEYKTRHDKVGKVIHWEMCNKLKFDHTNKWCMPNPEYVLVNETHRLLRDFEIQTYHTISARRPDLAIIKQEK